MRSAAPPGTLGAGLYRAENIAAVYDALLERAHRTVSLGRSVLLDGTWGDPRQRDRVRALAAQSSCPLTELCCAAPLADTVTRIETRTATTSQVTPDIAAAPRRRRSLRYPAHWPRAHRIDTTVPRPSPRPPRSEILPYPKPRPLKENHALRRRH